MARRYDRRLDGGRRPRLASPGTPGVGARPASPGTLGDGVGLASLGTPNVGAGSKASNDEEVRLSPRFTRRLDVFLRGISDETAQRFRDKSKVPNNLTS